jgi:UDP-N-acetylglucosamine transferase subunit ALG13
MARAGSRRGPRVLGRGAMIFVTIGSMLPFDRLVRLMDQWASRNSDKDVFAQIGNGSYQPRTMRWTRLLGRSEFTYTMKEAEFVVAHAGVGTVIMAQELGKRTILLPRRGAFHEHTNDHQLHTANWLAGKSGIFVASADEELWAIADRLAREEMKIEQFACNGAQVDFLAKIRAFLTA